MNENIKFEISEPTEKIERRSSLEDLKTDDGNFRSEDPKNKI